MAKKGCFIALMFFCSVAIAYADVITEGQLPKYFVITNLNKFDTYHFSFKYYTYTYHHGYHASMPVDSVCLHQQVHLAGTRFDTTRLEATDAVGNTYISDIAIGGDARVTDFEIVSITDEYEVVAIKNGVIQLTLKKEVLKYQDGRTKEGTTELGAIIGDDDNHVKRWLAGAAIVAIIGLITVFFIKSKKKLSPSI